MTTSARARNVGSSCEDDRHPEWITDPLGTHPIEAALGATLAGIFLALALGVVAGPALAAFGAAVGVLAGAVVGDGVAEVISPRIGIPADLAPRRRVRTSRDRAGFTDDPDDFKTFGTDRWPNWYDAIALGRHD